MCSKKIINSFIVEHAWRRIFKYNWNSAQPTISTHAKTFRMSSSTENICQPAGYLTTLKSNEIIPLYVSSWPLLMLWTHPKTRWILQRPDKPHLKAVSTVTASIYMMAKRYMSTRMKNPTRVQYIIIHICKTPSSVFHFVLTLHKISCCCVEKALQRFKSSCWKSETFLRLCQFLCNVRQRCDKNV